MVFQLGVSVAVGIKGHSLVSQGLHQTGQIAQPSPVDDKTVKSVADRDTTRLGVEHDGLAFLKVARLVKISVDNTRPRLDDWDTCRVTHKVDEPTPATRYAEVYIAHSVQHLARGLMGGRQERHSMAVHAMTA